MVAYVGGLVTTIVAMNVFDAAQPALIYLVPYCLLTVMALGAARGEFQELWDYSEEEEEEDAAGGDAAKAAAADKAAGATAAGAAKAPADADAAQAETKKDL